VVTELGIGLEHRRNPPIDYYQAMVGNPVYLQIQNSLLKDFYMPSTKSLSGEKLFGDMKKRVYCMPDFRTFPTSPQKPVQGGDPVSTPVKEGEDFSMPVRTLTFII
jgi:hypothetical protein